MASRLHKKVFRNNYRELGILSKVALESLITILVTINMASLLHKKDFNNNSKKLGIFVQRGPRVPGYIVSNKQHGFTFV